MITIKLKYKSDDICLIEKYIKQYTSLYHVCYNYIHRNQDISKFALEKKDSELNNLISKLNNIELLDSYFRLCAIDEAKSSYKEGKTIFGRRKNFLRRIKGHISNKELKELRLRPIYSIGEKSKLANRKFRIIDENTIIFQPNRKTKIRLELQNYKYKQIFSKLLDIQQNCLYPITYKLNKEYVFISYDETIIEQYSVKKLKHRMLGIDLNPNYIGWSIVDWKSSSKYKIVDRGIISSKKLNDLQFRRKLNSTQQVKYFNLRRNDVILIAKHLVNLAIHYQCEAICLEDLNMKSEDKEMGKNYNRLCNNLWSRNAFILNLTKRCHIYNLRLQLVKPEYSSFIGNIIFRYENLPDPILASIEIGRRGYEFISQYIHKEKKQTKNIVFPNKSDFYGSYVKSLEEFNISEPDLSWDNIYSIVKEKYPKQMYRVSLDKFDMPEFLIFLTPALHIYRINKFNFKL